MSDTNKNQECTTAPETGGFPEIEQDTVYIPNMGWVSAMKLTIMVLEHGNEEGKQMAREELLRAAGLLDKLNKVLPALIEGSACYLAGSLDGFSQDLDANARFERVERAVQAMGESV